MPRSQSRCARCGDSMITLYQVAQEGMIQNICSPCINSGDSYRNCECNLIYFGAEDTCSVCADGILKKCVSCGERRLPQELHFERCQPCIMRTRRHDNPFFYSLVDEINGPQNTYEIIKPKRTYGVELESCNAVVRFDDTHFSAVKDGSIEGQEFVSPILHGDMGAQEIRRLCVLSPGVSRSCGFHLHLDARDLKWWDIIMLGRGYALIQPIIFAMMAPSRSNNRHCLPITTPYYLMSEKSNIVKVFYEDARTQRKKKYIDKRYEFLNVHSYFYHKTIEIRCHGGTFNYNEIINWINFNQSLFDYFLKHRVEGHENPFEVLRKAIPESLHDYVIKRLELNSPRKEFLAYFMSPESYKVERVETQERKPSNIHSKRIHFYQEENYKKFFNLTDELEVRKKPVTKPTEHQALVDAASVAMLSDNVRIVHYSGPPAGTTYSWSVPNSNFTWDMSTEGADVMEMPPMEMPTRRPTEPPTHEEILYAHRRGLLTQDPARDTFVMPSGYEMSVSEFSQRIRDAQMNLLTIERQQIYSDLITSNESFMRRYPTRRNDSF